MRPLTTDPVPLDKGQPDGPWRGRIGDWITTHRGRVVLATTIALAASFLSKHYSAPAMPFALLLGMAFNFLADGPQAADGIGFCARTLLRCGVALLGLRLTFADVSHLGIMPIIGVVAPAGAGLCQRRLMLLAGGRDFGAGGQDLVGKAVRAGHEGAGSDRC